MIFYVIAMETKKGQTLYLGTMDAKSFKWYFDYDMGLYFPTEKDALSFAKEYFKNFKDYKVKEVYAKWKSMEQK